MSHYVYLIIVFADYLYRYYSRGFTLISTMLVYRIREYNYLTQKGLWNIVIEAMQFIQNQTFPTRKGKQKKMLAKSISKTELCNNFNVPLPIIYTIAEMALPRPDTHLMKQIIEEHEKETTCFSLTLVQRLFDLIDEKNETYKGTGIWPHEACDGNNYESPLCISTKIEGDMKYNYVDLCAPDGTVFIDLNRKVFCCLQFFELSFRNPETGQWYQDTVDGRYYQFFEFNDVLTIAKIVANEIDANESANTMEEYEKQLCFILSSDEIMKELAKKNKGDNSSRIVAAKKESYLDLFNRYQSCLLSKDNDKINKHSKIETKSAGSQVDQHVPKNDELSEPPKKRQRIS